MDTMAEVGPNLANAGGLGFPALVVVPTDEVWQIWPRVGPLFLVFEEVEPVLYTRVDLFNMLSTGQMQLHLAHDGDKFSMAAISEILEYPRCRMCRIVFASGTGPEIINEVFEWFADWARNRKCEWIEFVGRPGWEKVLKPCGFTKHSIIFEKRI